MIAKGDIKNAISLIGNDDEGIMLKSRLSLLMHRENIDVVDSNDLSLNQNKILHDMLKYAEGRQEDNFI